MLEHVAHTRLDAPSRLSSRCRETSTTLTSLEATGSSAHAVQGWSMVPFLPHSGKPRPRFRTAANIDDGVRRFLKKRATHRAMCGGAGTLAAAYRNAGGKAPWTILNRMR